MSWWGKYVLGFIIVSLLGLSIMFPAETPIVAMAIDANPSQYSLVFIGLSMLVALVAGYLLPKGFWLWGFAVVSLRIPTEAILITRDVEMGRFNESEVLGLAFVVALFLAFVVALFYFTTILFFSFASTVGAGLRLIWRRFQSGRWQGREA